MVEAVSWQWQIPLKSRKIRRAYLFGVNEFQIWYDDIIYWYILYNSSHFTDKNTSWDVVKFESRRMDIHIFAANKQIQKVGLFLGWTTPPGRQPVSLVNMSGSNHCFQRYTTVDILLIGHLNIQPTCAKTLAIVLRKKSGKMKRGAGTVQIPYKEGEVQISFQNSLALMQCEQDQPIPPIPLIERQQPTSLFAAWKS